MTILRNMKISGKLALGFGLLLAIIVILAIATIVNMNANERSMDLFQQYPTARLHNLLRINESYTELRRLVATMSFRLGDTQALTVLRNDAQRTYDQLLVLLDENIHSLRTDPSILEERRVEFVSQSEDIREMIVEYFNTVVIGMFDTAMGGIVGDTESRLRVEETFALGIAFTDEVIAALYALEEGTLTTVNNRLIEMSATTAATISTTVILSIVGVLLGVACALLITSMISKPISEVSKILSNVSAGNMSINFKSNLPKDEVGAMTQNVYSLVDVIKNIVSDLDIMYKEFIEIGNIEYEINSGKYQNAFREMMVSVNKMNSQMVLDFKSVAEAMDHVNDGDFSKDMDSTVWVGEWVFVPRAFGSLLGNIRAISTEVNAMIDSIAAKGDLNFKIDETKYKGDWGNIMAGLNDVAKAVEAPVIAMEISLNEMKKGNFNLDSIDKAVAAQGFNADATAYEGVFKSMATALNDTLIEINAYIGEITRDLAALASGDLTTSITRNFVGDFGPIKESLNHISTTLNKTMSEISVASEQVLSGANQISTSAQELANGAQEQASSVQELTASIDMVNQQTRQNADNAIEASEISNRSTTNAREGSKSMDEMVTAMTQIKSSSSDIFKIIKTIQDIAFQTNLLALNAAVEAARAGEHGKGFAVVAEEVRSLAGRSQESATETTGLIETSNSRVESGSAIAETTSQSLDMIVKNAAEVSALINNISDSSKEQAEAIAQISQGLSEISRVTQSNSAVSEETAAASQELNSQAEVLRQLVAYFKL